MVKVHFDINGNNSVAGSCQKNVGTDVGGVEDSHVYTTDLQVEI